MRVHVTLHGFAEARSRGADEPAGSLSEPRERDLDLADGAEADDAARACGIRPELVIVFRGEPRSRGEGEDLPQQVWSPLPGDAPLREGDRVRILRVVSGGRGRLRSEG